MAHHTNERASLVRGGLGRYLVFAMRYLARSTPLVVAAAGMLAAFGCDSAKSPSPEPEPEPPRIIQLLVFSKTEGFRHESIDAAKEVLGGLDETELIEVTLTEDSSTFSDEGLAEFDVVLFANTTGDVLGPAEQEAFTRFIQKGGGYVGAHSAADTEHDWPWYGRLVGAYFASHPLLPLEAELFNEDPLHTSMDELPSRFLFTDEWYNFDRNPRFDNHILMTVDESFFYDADGQPWPTIPLDQPFMGDDHPIAWNKEFEGGRSWYTNLGHRPETWRDERFMSHLLDGVRWAAEPTAFSRMTLTTAPRNPLALEVAPDGRVFYVEITGELMVWDPRTGETLEALVLEVDNSFENGLLGLALDPGFAENGHIYLYASLPVAEPPPASGPPGLNVLARFTVGDNGRIDPATRVELLRVPSERECCHEGGDLHFGPDGTLYLSVGDNTDPFAANGFAPLDQRSGRDRFDSRRTAANPNALRGKILRINPDGSIPDGNMFSKSGTEGRPEIFVMGVRNPFRIAVDSMTGRLFWGDVGPDAPLGTDRGPQGFDEINYADSPGDYGWPFCISENRPYADFDYETETAGAPFSCAGKRPSLLSYDYLTIRYPALGDAASPEAGSLVGALEDASFTGRTAIAGVVYRPPVGAPFALPEQYWGNLLMTDWTRDIIAAVHVNDEGRLGHLRRLLQFEDFRRPIDLDVGPDGALYVLEYGTSYGGDNADAKISRIEHSAAGELTPVARAVASPLAGNGPLTVTLTSEGSRAPGLDDRIVAYEWDVDGDGVVDGTGPSHEHTYEEAGSYFPALVVVGASGRRSLPSAARVVVGNTPPVVTITSPAEGMEVGLGEVITLEGMATDMEDGVADCSRLSWDIRLGHNAHSHPTARRTGCSATFTAFIDHGGDSGLFYAIELSYEDDGGAMGEPPLTGRASVRLEVAQ